MIWGLVCVLIVIAAIVAALVMSSGGAFNQRVLYRLYERVGPQVYGNQEDTNWDILMEHLGLHGDENILDVGTAVGDFPLFIAQKAEFRGHVIGIDWSPKMLDVARRQLAELGLTDRVEFALVDVRDGLPYPKDSFDVVVSVGVLETMGGDQALVLYELGRVLKPNGTLVLSRFRGWSSWSADRIQRWYEQQFITFGMELESVLSFRPSHDLMIIRWASVEELSSPF